MMMSKNRSQTPFSRSNLRNNNCLYFDYTRFLGHDDYELPLIDSGHDWGLLATGGSIQIFIFWRGIGDLGLGIGDLGFGIRDWGLLAS